MPNGKFGDNPLTDMFTHGQHPYPADIEEMLRRLHSINPKILQYLDAKPFDWEKGGNLEEGRELLNEMLITHGESDN